MRTRLLREVQLTEGLRERPENRHGMLRRSAPVTEASRLYSGRLYGYLRNAWMVPSLRILIVSAGYGLVRPDEKIRNYNLQMLDALHDGRLLADFWRASELSRLLETLVARRQIKQVWSLLSMTYQEVLEDFWACAREADIEARWVRVFTESGTSAGIGEAGKRGEWLEAIASRANRGLYRSPETRLKEIPGCVFEYCRC